MASKTTLLGAAGEHYVMSQLLRRDMIAALAPAGVPHADILVSDDIGDRLCAIQVKSRRDIGSDGGWHMSKKHESISLPSFFYCFLDFGKSVAQQPKTWILPSKVVADVLTLSHKNWLAMPGKKGQPHKDVDMRRFLPDHTRLHNMDKKYALGWLDKYYDAWDLLVPKNKQTP